MYVYVDYFKLCYELMNVGHDTSTHDEYADYHLQRQRVRTAMVRVDPEGAALRSLRNSIDRSQYVVASPNTVWHIDGKFMICCYH